VGRIAIKFRPTDAFEDNLLVNQYNAGGTLAPYVPVEINPKGAARAKIGPALDAYIAEQISLGYYSLVGSSLPSSVENRNRVRQTNIANITSLQLSPALTLKNIFGYEREYDFTQFDADGTPYKIYDNNVPGSTPAGTNRLYTEEFQAQGLTLAGKLNYTAGLFYARSDPGTAGTVIADLTGAYGIKLSTTASSQFETEAVYGQGTYDFGNVVEGLKFTGGYRYTIDRRWLDQKSATIVPAFGLVLPNAPLNLSSESKNGSYTLGLTYQPTSGVMYYLTNSKGFLNGGFNTSVTRAADAPYAPESLNNIELGVKTDNKIGDMAYRANVAAYYGFYNDAQVSVTTVINAGTPQQALAVLTKNAAKGLVRGLEWNFHLIPIAALEVGTFGSYMDNKYSHYASLSPTGQPVDLSNTPFVYTPKWKYGVTANVHFLTSENIGDGSATATYTHQSSVITTSTLHPQFYDMGPGFGNLNLSLNWNGVMGKHGLDASIFVNNVLQNKDANGGFGAYSSLGVRGYSPAIPRIVGVRLKESF
jgi:iron complex outermembrane receptor protein